MEALAVDVTILTLAATGLIIGYVKGRRTDD